MPSYSGVWTLTAVYQAVGANNWTNPPPPRGVFAGGWDNSGVRQNVIDYVIISSTGNATNFGSLTSLRSQAAGCGSSTRGITAGGFTPGTRASSIEYITFATTGNATFFGNLAAGTYPETADPAAFNSDTRGIIAGGQDAAGRRNTIEYITIATTGNSTYFGDLTIQVDTLAGCSSPTRGLSGGGYQLSPAGRTNVISYVTIATLGNATDFGDLTTARSALASASSSTRGLWFGGASNSNVIDYVTIATTGNATDFGDLPAGNDGTFTAVSSTTRGVPAGGYVAGVATNTMNYITIATTGNAVSFGELTVGRYALAGMSSANGGVQ